MKKLTKNEGKKEKMEEWTRKKRVSKKKVIEGKGRVRKLGMKRKRRRRKT